MSRPLAVALLLLAPLARADEIDDLVARLDDGRFAVRQKASRVLELRTHAQGADGVRRLQRALGRATSPEVRRRLTRVIERLRTPRIAWAARAGARSFRGPAPILGAREVLLPTAEGLICLERASGELRWRVAVQGATQLDAARKQVVVAMGQRVMAFGLRTGRKRWSVTAELGKHAVGLALVGDGLVVAPVGGRVFCVGAARGEMRWTSKMRGGGMSVHGSRVLLLGWHDHRRQIGCLDAASGALRWRVRARRDGHVPVVVGDTGYVTTEEKWGKVSVLTLTALNLETGARRWRRVLANVSQWHRTRPLVVGDRVIVAARECMLAFDRDTGQQQWRVGVPEDAAVPRRNEEVKIAGGKVGWGYIGPLPSGYNGLCTDGRVVYAMTYAGQLVGLRAADGARLFLASLPRAMSEITQQPGTPGPARVSGNHLYCSTSHGWAVALRLPLGLGVAAVARTNARR